MADNPGNLLSSVCLGRVSEATSSSSSHNSSSNKYGSCVNIFIHLFDWNRRLSRRGLFPGRRFLAGGSQEQVPRKRRRNNRRKNMKLVEDRLPMAKLLLIADENRRGKCEAAPEIHSLQELLHLEQEEPPKMLHELLVSSKNSSRRELQQRHQQQDKGEFLLNLLIQEVKHHQERQRVSDQVSKQRKTEVGLLSKHVMAAPEKTSRSNSCVRSPFNRCPSVASAGTAGIAGLGCGAFSRRTSSLFLEAAAKILDPKNRSSRRPARALGRVSSDNSSRRVTREAEVRILGPPASLVDNPNTGRIPRQAALTSTSSDAGSTSIRSLMELFLDDLEQDMATPSMSRSSSERACSIPEACESPKAEPRTVNLSPPTTSAQKTVVVPLEELEEHDYVSFRDFLTDGGVRAKAAETRSKVEPERNKPVEFLQETCSSSVDDFKFMVHNPLFDDSSRIYSDSELDNEDDHGLEEILKSILYQTTPAAASSGQTSDTTGRLTWLPNSSSNLSPRENFLYNKDSSSEADETHQTDIDSVELTSESNCGDDCGQPSPVSVLDSPFDDEVKAAGKRGSSVRKRLDFSDDPTTTSSSSSSSPTSSSRASFTSCLQQRFDLNTLREAEEYILTVLEESGISYHADVTLLAATEKNGGIVSNSVFERLEDRVRVQQLIEHLEACGSTSSSEERSSHHSLESLRAHYESYHECRSRRRMVFDFVNELLGSLVDQAGEWEPVGIMGIQAARSGEELVQEARRQLQLWKREAFESVHELVNREVASSNGKGFREEVGDIGAGCVKEILMGLVEELAADLLAC